MNLEKWLYLASWVVWTAFMFLPAMHERYDYAAIILISAFTWMLRGCAGSRYMSASF